MTVTAWTFSVEEYMELAEVPDGKQTRLAATWLSGVAKVWYINTYRDVKPLPPLKDFIKAFEEQHLMAHSKADVIKHAETICRGSQRGTSEYSTEFKMLILQLGYKSNEPNDWVMHHYLRGLNKTVRDNLVPHLDKEKDTLDVLIKKANNIARNVEFGKSLDYGFNCPTSASASRSLNAQASPRSASRGYMSYASGMKPVRSKLSDADKDYLRRNKGCFSCGRINAGHIAEKCPDRLAAAKSKEVKEVKKESISALDAVVKSDSDFEYSRPKPISAIKIATQIGKALLPSTLVDCGAMVNVISEDKVTELTVPTRLMPPMKLHEPLSPHGTHVGEKVVSKVRIPDKDWESSQPAEFIVAPLKEHDAILGMPFLAEKGVLIDPARGKIVLPTLKEESGGGLEDIIDGGIRKETRVMTEADGDEDQLNYPAMYPSICPKLRTIPKIEPPRQDIKRMNPSSELEAPISSPDAVDLQLYLAKFKNVPLSDLDPTARESQ